MGLSERTQPVDGETISAVRLQALARELGIDPHLVTGDGTLPSDGVVERQLLTGFLNLFSQRKPVRGVLGDLREETTSLDEIERKKLSYVVGSRKIHGTTYRVDIYSFQGYLFAADLRKKKDFPFRSRNDQELTIIFPASPLDSYTPTTKTSLRTAIGIYGEFQEAFTKPIKPRDRRR